MTLHETLLSGCVRLATEGRKHDPRAAAGGARHHALAYKQRGSGLAMAIMSTTDVRAAVDLLNKGR